MKFEYRIPLIHIILMIGLSLTFVLGSHGFLDDSFKQDTFTRASSLIVFIVLSIWIIKTPRDRSVVLSDHGIEIPAILLPPYTSNFIKWADIVDWDYKCLRNGNREFLLYTNEKKYIIKSWLIQGNYEISLNPKNFEKINDEIHKYLFE